MTLLTDPEGIPQQFCGRTLELCAYGGAGFMEGANFTLGFRFVHSHPPPRESQPLLLLRPTSIAETDAARPRIMGSSCILKLFW
jgi:hypothetical protein